MSAGVKCKECGAHFEGSRTDARRAQWEPWSYSSQHGIDHGPMVCSGCMGRLLDNLVVALKEAMQAGRF